MPEFTASDIAALVARIEVLEVKLAACEAELVESRAELARKDQIIKGLGKKLFGSSSERMDPDQLELLIEEEVMGKPEPPADDASSEPEAGEEEDQGKRKPRRKKKDLYPKNLMIRVVAVLEPEEVKDDPEGHYEISEEHHDELECIPEQLYWKRTVRKKYKSKHDPGAPPLIAPAPEPTLPGTLISSQIAARIICDKYCDHLPFYRQSQRFGRRFGVEIGRSTLTSWAMSTAKHLELIGQAIRDEMMAARVLQVDETPLRYLRPGSGKAPKGYLWIYHDLEQDTVLYDWQLTRAGNCIEDVLGDFAGYLQCDGYSGYLKYASEHSGVILAACMAHIRRKFFEAHEGGAIGTAQILSLIQKLYRIERELREQKIHHSCRGVIRRARAGPIVKELRAKILHERQNSHHLPKSKMGEALRYALGQWAQFERYLEEGCLEIDNNLVENAVRPTKLGAKNYLFFGSAEAGHPNALLYTLIENAKRQGLDPEDYLEEVIRRLPENATQEEAAAATPAKIAQERAAKAEDQMAA